MSYDVRLPRAAKNALASGLPEGVAAAVLQFLDSRSENPYRLGKPLGPPLEGTTAPVAVSSGSSTGSTTTRARCAP